MGLANVSRPFGFIPLIGGGRANPITRVRPVPTSRTSSVGGGIASTDMAIGDAYAIDASGNTYRAGTQDIVRGIIVGFVLGANGAVMNGNGPVSLDYVTGTLSTAILLIGIEDNDVDFSVQSDTFAATNVGQLFNLKDAAPDSLWRQSRQTINIGGGIGAQFQAIDIVGGPGTWPGGTNSNPSMGNPDDAYGANAQIIVKMLQAMS